MFLAYRHLTPQGLYSVLRVVFAPNILRGKFSPKDTAHARQPKGRLLVFGIQRHLLVLHRANVVQLSLLTDQRPRMGGSGGLAASHQVL